ncbi:LamG-like jellyroll fold domain-containing protein [Anaerobaca lacustris]|uniref:Discoidin domain-containing protein n=1 Tax=Anaerobaca lacustris TaxID=3044600 RepID=A0AAW6TSV6_9BACT|nr:discoidin domain-containing protein [Sedimentisphaerales bacterium M17dextr]
MSKMKRFTVFVCMLLVANAWGAPFMDDFNRPDGLVGNGWATQTNGTIEILIVDQEVLIAGTQATDWVRCGISRPVSGENKVSFDFLANDNFNMHVNIASADSSAYLEIYCWPGGPLTHANSVDGGWPGWVEITGAATVAGEYNNVMLEQNGTEITVTLNGTVVGTLTNANFVSIESVLISSDAAAGTTGSLHIDNVKIGDVVTGIATDPRPASDATDIARDVVLGWTPGESAVTHDVYFGTTLAAVEEATRANPMGVLLSQGQTGTTFDPPGGLDYEQTYYWRVDEVNGAPDFAVFTGVVWSFTVEPFVYPIQNIIATASSAEEGAGPQNTINSSGLNAAGQHAIEADDMWLTDMTAPEPAWIQYEFPEVYKLHEMWVWNYNVQFELILGFGLKDVTIEYSVDGVEWTALGDHEFAQATATATYVHNTTIGFDGVAAKYIRLTANSNWGGRMPQFGLSEVRFLYKPVMAREPEPANGQSGVELDVVLDWRGGREAAVHEVYFSADRAAVASGEALVATASASRHAVSGLDLGQIYYWKIDEVNEAAEPSVWAGPIWSFSTKEYITVENFEAYNDDIDAGTAIFQTWIDGWENNTGSTVGYLETPFAERRIVFAGSQAMPLEYDNATAPYYSEAERDFGGANWTVSGADTLVVHFRGNAAATDETPGNAPAPVYVALEDRAGRTAVVTHPDPEATVITQWQTWEIPFSSFGGVAMNNVEMMYIGVGNRTNPVAGGSGRIYVDEIGVGRPGVVDPGNSGLVAYYALEGDVEDGSGNGHHGIAVGDPVYVPGQVGSGLHFDGTGAQYVDLGTLNPSAATGQLSVSLWANWDGLSGQYQGLIGKRDPGWSAAEMMWQIEANIDTGIVRFQREGIADIPTAALPIGEWYHVAVTFDGAVGKVYMAGQLGAEAAFSFGSDPTAAMVFGASVRDGGNPFNGALDEIRFYDRVLSPFEIRYLAGQ